ncbi:MAG TPA: gamma-glutamyl-phosphate reductase, partial [Terriglobales bacterium]
MATFPAMASTTREKIGRAHKAAALLAQFSTSQKNSLLLQMAGAIETHVAEILSANEQDLALADMSGALRDRLLLNDSRVAGMAAAVRDVAALPDPVNEVLEEWTQPNGLLIR